MTALALTFELVGDKSTEQMLRSPNGHVRLRPPVESDADALYDALVHSRVTDTIAWDGPESLETYREGLRERGRRGRREEVHMFTIIRCADEARVGTADVRLEDAEARRWSVGLWIAETAHGHGLGTEAVATLTRYACSELAPARLGAAVFVGNWSSRRVFEKNGYRLEQTIEAAVQKRERWIDEWLMVYAPGT